ncbi:GNAT family N-acetyltransferase [Thermoactinospora rubra]|uniref:GNAT family N-acetyltransferase n=1 Tax=Thermoactinospora rubra TaxID=1088767 RepID=UPI000A102CD1|nr:N-acetyltransferase [Thermoactinospora rubra]
MSVYTLRRPAPGDAAEIFRLVTAAHTAVLGFVDATLDDIADELAEPGFDLDRDGWLAHDADGRPAGWAWACRKGDSDNVDIDVIVRPGGEDLAEQLWATVIGRAREIARELGHQAVTLDVGVYRADTAQQERARAHGFAPATGFHRMRIDFDGPVPEPDPPPGVTLHPTLTDEARRQAHAIHEESFADHFGFVPSSYAGWHERREASSTHDWTQGLVARVDGEPAAALLAGNQFAADEDCGYVAMLGVLPRFRGRGLARLLLRTAFARDAARGRKGTILHVDANNVTPALGLYTSAGMRQVLAIDVWRRRLPV